MKKICFILFFIPILAFAEDIKLLSWNVFMLPKPINFSKQAERTPLIASELLNADYDIILLQEAFQNKFRNKLGRLLKDQYPYQDHLRKSVRPKHIINSGLFVASKLPFEVLGWHYFNYCTHADCFSAKGVLLIELTTPNGSKVQVAMSHLQAWDDPKAIGIRAAQIHEISELLKIHARPGIPQILAGDLNIDANFDLELPGALSDLGMTNSELTGELRATNGFEVPCYKTPGKPSAGKWLDHIWLKNIESDAEVLNKKIVPFSAVMRSGMDCSLSDHYGIEATIRL